MPQKKDNLPINADVDLQNGGTITYANEVIAIIAGVAANEIDGVAGMCISGGFGDILGKNRNITRGVKVEIGSEEAAVDLFTVIEYGKPIQKVASEVQENVRKAIESMTGLHVVRVDVHVQGVSFEKEKIAAQSSLEAAHNPVLESPQAETVTVTETTVEETTVEKTTVTETTVEIPVAEAPAEPEAPAEIEEPCECAECASEPEAPCECAEAPAEPEEIPEETPAEPAEPEDSAEAPAEQADADEQAEAQNAKKRRPRKRA